jgi:hypothetical protein
MKIYTTIQRGCQHKVYCEDFLLTTTQGDWFFGVVSDGCSSGKDSHLASALSCKLLRKQISLLVPAELDSPQEVALKLLQGFMQDFRQVLSNMDLTAIEALATLLLLVYDAKTNKAFVVVLGDGLVSINETMYEIDQKNSPDYPAYHLDDSKEMLEKYFLTHYFEVENPQQIAIATDGILQFINEKAQAQKVDNKALMQYLLVDNTLQNVVAMLSRKINILYSQQGLVPSDDVAIIRLNIA